MGRLWGALLGATSVGSGVGREGEQREQIGLKEMSKPLQQRLWRWGGSTELVPV